MFKIFIVLIVIIIVVMIECAREILTFKITRYDIKNIKLNGIKPKKVILLSDLHNCHYGKDNQKLLEAIKAETPDIILVAGDMLIGNIGHQTIVAEKLMVELPKICATYYGNGNHEQRMKEYPEKYGSTYEQYKQVLVTSGVHYLENEKVTVNWDGNEIEIYGVEIPNSYYKKFQKVTMEPDTMVNCLGKSNHDKYQILIAHNPMFIKEYLEWGADLVVSGHLHGGVARIPFWRGVITPQGGLFPKYSGELTQVGTASVVVSKGIGIHTIPIRFLNPTEMIVLNISGVEE